MPSAPLIRRGMHLSDNMRGALFMVGAMTAYTVNDGFIKAAGADLPVMQATFWRSMMVLPLMVILCVMLRQLRFGFSRRD